MIECRAAAACTGGSASTSAGRSRSGAICRMWPGCSAGEADVSSGTVTRMDNVEFDGEPPASLTTLVMAFGGWIDAGGAATGALRHLTGDLRAERLARIDPEEFFVFTQERPEVRLRADGDRDIHWPRSEFFARSPEDRREGLLLFCGPEPP